MSHGPSESERVRALREVLTATGAGIYLATHLAGPLPAETQAAIHESDELELRLGRAGPDRGADLEQRQREARAVAGAVLKAAPERLVLAHGTPEAVAAISLDILSRRGGDGDRVLILRGTREPVAAAVSAAAEATGASVELLDETPRIIWADVTLVVMSHVDIDGRRADVAAVGQSADKAGARLLVDASLSLGALPVHVTELAADVVVADAHRWLLGPEAVTFAWLGHALGEDAPSRIGALAGPFGRGALLGLARSVGWLLMYVELPWLLARTERLSEHLHDALDAIVGVEVTAPPGARSPLVSFRIEGWDAEQAGDELSRSVFAILEADTEHDLLRAGVGAWNREDEIDRFIGRVAELASHTPETLPRRPSLTVLTRSEDGGGDR